MSEALVGHLDVQGLRISFRNAEEPAMAPRQEAITSDLSTKEVHPEAEAALEAEIARRMELSPGAERREADVVARPRSPMRRTFARLGAYLDGADLDVAEREANFHEGDDRW